MMEPFTDEAGALEYATMREAVRVAAVAGQSLNRNEWPLERISFAATGRGAFMAWYWPIADKFDELAREMQAAEDAQRVDELAAVGDKMHTFYAAELRSGRIPHLPKHLGDKYVNVLRAWENLRRVMAS